MPDDIVPDDKNWTWVLEQRCGECGYEASSFDAALAGAAVRDLAVRWAAVLSQRDVAVRPRAGVWSPLEYSCHVRDVFRIFDRRLERMLGEETPAFENWDQDRTAVDDDYAGQDPVRVAAELVIAGAALATRFDTVAGAQWSRRGIRSDGAEFTVRSIAKYLMHDPVHHLWDVGAAVPGLAMSTHRTLAVDANNSTWELLGVSAVDRGDAGDEEMTRRAYAAAYHWQRAVGSSPANAARADWLLSRVWAVRGVGDLALHHARRCMTTCDAAGLADFDLAYAHEALARAHACRGEVEEALRQRELARRVPIEDAEDKAVVDADLDAEPWFGVQ